MDLSAREAENLVSTGFKIRITLPIPLYLRSCRMMKVSTITFHNCSPVIFGHGNEKIHSVSTNTHLRSDRRFGAKGFVAFPQNTVGFPDVVDERHKSRSKANLDGTFANVLECFCDAFGPAYG
jgi:hypothetical protein